MSEQSKLREGIDAAKRGDKTTARRLLQQVLSTDGDNELALMWMASVVDSVEERRFFLERALRVNPNNDRAREALRRLGVDEPEAPRRTSSAAGEPVQRTGGGGVNSAIYLIAAAVVAVVVVAVLVAAAVSSLQPQVTPVSAASVQSTFAALVATPTKGPTEDLISTKTPTILPGIVVTLDPNLITPLPPTFTPTVTLTPADTATPAPTLIPLTNFKIVYSDIESGAPAPSLYRGNADGTGEIKLQAADAGGFADVATSPDGQRIAFVRPVGAADGTSLPQLFVASLASLDSPQTLTTLTGTVVAHPSWSPDGSKIIFDSNADGDEDIMVINADGTNLTPLTTNSARDFDPQFTPDGKSIVFASDMNSPSFSEIFIMTLNGGDITQLTDVPNSYSPTMSPDGTKIAYINDQQGDGDIYLMDADGQRPTLLTQNDNDAEDRTPAWSPDGNWIVFASNRDGEEFRWFAIDLQGNVQPVTVTGRNPQSLSFITG